MTRSLGPRGANPNDGTVAPKSATTGVRTPAARCAGALSLETSTRQRRISSADCSGDSSPAAFSGVSATAAAIRPHSGRSSRPPISTRSSPELLEHAREQNKLLLRPPLGIPDGARRKRDHGVPVESGDTRLMGEQDGVHRLTVAPEGVEGRQQLPDRRTEAQGFQKRKVTVDFVEVPAIRHAIGQQGAPRTRVESHPSRNPRGGDDQGAAHRPMRDQGKVEATASQGPGQLVRSAQSPLALLFVVRDDGVNGGMAFKHGGRSRNHCKRDPAPGIFLFQRLRKGERQDDIPQKRSLKNEDVPRRVHDARASACGREERCWRRNVSVCFQRLCAQSHWSG